MANQPLNKNFFIASVLIHLFIMFSVSYMIKQDAISNKNFVIFGAHSRHTTKALYKNTAIPFTEHPSGIKRKKDSKKSVQKEKKKVRNIKKLSKKNASTHTNKKPRTATKPQIVKELSKKQPLTMPSPTAVTEEPTQKQSKKNSPKKKPSIKKEIAYPQQIKKETKAQNFERQEESSQKSEDPIVATENTKNEKIDSETPAKNTTQDSLGGDDDGGNEEIIHVGVVDSTDPVTRYHQRVIGQEFSRLWQPPVGVRKGTECTVKIAIDAKGAVSNIEFIKRSQVPIYDLSILRLKITKPEFPPSLYGKHMIVVFHQ